MSTALIEAVGAGFPIVFAALAAPPPGRSDRPLPPCRSDRPLPPGRSDRPPAAWHLRSAAARLAAQIGPTTQVSSEWMHSSFADRKWLPPKDFPSALPVLPLVGGGVGEVAKTNWRLTRVWANPRRPTDCFALAPLSLEQPSALVGPSASLVGLVRWP